MYCISRNFCEVFIFANFASEHKIVKLKTRENNFLQKVCTMNVKIAKLNWHAFGKTSENAKISSRENIDLYSIRLLLNSWKQIEISKTSYLQTCRGREKQKHRKIKLCISYQNLHSSNPNWYAKFCNPLILSIKLAVVRLPSSEI